MPHPSPAIENDLSHSDECRTQHLSAEFSNCLAGHKRYRCNYALLFGDGYLCNHPKHNEFR